MFKRVLLGLLALVIGGLGFFGIRAAIDYDKEQQRIDAAQLVEFRADLETNGFETAGSDVGPVVIWKKEGDEKELDATIVVAGCKFQAERSELEADTQPRVVNGVSQMKPYKLDEWVNGSRDGVDVAKRGRNRAAFTTPNPTRPQVYKYLADHGTGVFPCFKAAPVRVPVG